jgi:predicted Zn-dependent peptidase
VTHQVSTLRNGLRVVSEPMPGLRSVALGAFIGTGSRDEDASVSGVSHFIEHLLFRGTESYSALEIAQTFDRFGAELNAATSRELTEIYARVIDTHVAEAVSIVASMINRPTFAELEQEREVVLEELAMYEDTPDEIVHDLISEAVFPDQPLGRPVIGSIGVLEGLGVDQITAHHHRYYQAGNVVIAAAGAVDHQQLAELVAAELDPLASGSAPARAAAEIPTRPRRVFQTKDTEQYHVCVAAPGVSRHDPRRFAASLLDQILGGGASSRLFQEIRERRGMAYAVYSFSSHYHETGMFGVYVGTREDNVAECLSVIGAEIRALAHGAFETDEVERAKDSLKGRIALSLESTTTRMGRVGRSLLLGSELLEPDEVYARVDAVTPSDIAGLASDLLDPRLVSSAGIGPDEQRFAEACDALAAAA